MTKYEPLRRHLEGLKVDVWTATFVEVAGVLGFPQVATTRAF